MGWPHQHEYMTFYNLSYHHSKMTGTRMLLTTVLLIIAVGVQSTVSELSPILLVPGFSGSQLEARISDRSNCDTNGQWMRYWQNMDTSTDCVNKVLEQQYDDNNNVYSNLPGIEVNVPGFGDTDTVEYLDTDHPEQSAYLDEFVDYFVKKGYERGKTIRAAPYDWRLAPDGLNKIGFYRSFRTLVEEMYNTDNEKVSIVGHSFGGPVTLYFFNNIVTQDWKDKYINVFVPLSGAWSGGNGVLLTYISKIGLDQAKPYGTSLQTMESSAWFVPNPLIWKDEVVLTTDSKNYTANDYKELFVDTLKRQVDYNRILRSNGNFLSPKVPTHCYFGVGLPTLKVVNYGSGLPETFESVTNGDGDAVVNLLTSEACMRWSSQKQSFQAKRFYEVDHYDMVKNTIVLDAVAGAILNP